MPDIARDPTFLKRRRLRRIGYVAVVMIVLIGVSIVLARIEPAAPTVDADALVRDAVKRGSFVHTVRGSGTLVPEDTRWISKSPGTTDDCSQSSEAKLIWDVHCDVPRGLKPRPVHRRMAARA